MVEYVCGFVRREDEVYLVLKNRPSWQAGRLNGVGGKIERSETPLEAMEREWLEETGTIAPHFDRFHVITGPDWTVYFFRGEMDDETARKIRSVNDVGETLEWHSLNMSLDCPLWMSDVYAIPNLSWLIPMAFSDPSHVSGTSVARVV